MCTEDNKKYLLLEPEDQICVNLILWNLEIFELLIPMLELLDYDYSMLINQLNEIQLLHLLQE